MPFWSFKKRRRSGIKDSATQPLVDEKSKPDPPSRAATYPPPGPTPPIPIPRKSSKRGSVRRQRESSDDVGKGLGESEKENVPPGAERSSSREDITALPMSRQLQHSPHLRPVDTERPHIPYQFRDHNTSQSSVPRQENVASPARPQTLRSKSSRYESASLARRQSSRRSKKEEQLREEEIRAMSAQVPMPKRPAGFSEGPLRRDSKKMRSGMKDSYVSLPAEDSITERMSGIIEQRGWEVGSVDMFNPRPAVRLSGVPQYVTPSSVSSSVPMSPELGKQKEKLPVSRDSARKRETVGNRADDLDASDLRTVMERDAKRREKRKKEQQEKLDRKLRNRAGRNRGDSDKKKREAEDARRAKEYEQQPEDGAKAAELTGTAAAVHPALRDSDDQQQETVGLGIGDHTSAGAPDTREQTQDDVELADAQAEDPFADPPTEQVATPSTGYDSGRAGTATPSETPMEDAVVVGTAQAVRMSQANTPPLSPVHAQRDKSGLSQVMDAGSPIEAPTPPPKSELRQSNSKAEPRSWGSFFRRGGTAVSKSDAAKTAPVAQSFSNTSRESMRNQPLPPQLIDTSVKQPRRTSGTPVRTQSKFREELPGMPISPPDSRMPSPDVTTAAAAAAATRRGETTEGTPRSEGDTQVPRRNDTPVSPTLRMMSTSMASVDSEGSWLSSGKRQSAQSGRIGSLSQLKPKFTASYEELGADKDAEHFSRGAPSDINKEAMIAQRASGSVMPSESEADEFYDAPSRAETEHDDEGDDTEEEQGPETPMAMHASARRQPTLVHRDPRIRSREGLLTEMTAADLERPETPVPQSAGTGKTSMDIDDSDPETPEPFMQRATSVDYGKGRGHARQVSAGSARLLDVGSRASMLPEDGEASSSKL